MRLLTVAALAYTLCSLSVATAVSVSRAGGQGPSGRCTSPEAYNDVEKLTFSDQSKTINVLSTEARKIYHPKEVVCWNESFDKEAQAPLWNCQDRDTLKSQHVWLKDFHVHCQRCPGIPWAPATFDPSSCTIDVTYAFTDQGRLAYERATKQRPGWGTALVVAVVVVVVVTVWLMMGAAAGPAEPERQSVERQQPRRRQPVAPTGRRQPLPRAVNSPRG